MTSDYYPPHCYRDGVVVNSGEQKNYQLEQEGQVVYLFADEMIRDPQQFGKYWTYLPRDVLCYPVDGGAADETQEGIVDRRNRR